LKIAELLEGTLRRGHYDYGHHPTARDMGLAYWYNEVVPKLSQIFKIPAVNFKAQGDFGFDWYQSKNNGLYSTEKALLRVILRKKGLDADLIASMLPKALKAELSRRFVDVEVSPAKLTPAEEDLNLRLNPPYLDLSFKTKYPQAWIDHDKQRYNINWN
jgi:hypothetical protein